MKNLITLLEPPARLNISPADDKNFAVVALASILGAILHFLFLLLFLYFEVTFMAYFNIVSICIFTAAFIINRNSVGKWVLLVNIFCTEVVIHAIASVTILGWDSNFHIYLFAPILCTFLVSSSKSFSKSSIFFTITSAISYVFLAIYTQNHPPLQAVSTLGMHIFSVMNVLNSVIVITAITFYFNYTANQSIEEVSVKNEELAQQADTLHMQSQQLHYANKNMSDSIQYAYRLQKAILSAVGQIENMFGKEHAMVVYLPKDVVSGDFYWCREKNGEKIIAVADCTGHGVPGAMLTVIGNSLINHIVLEKNITDPALILESMQMYFTRMFSDTYNIRDGMDIAVVKINFLSEKIYFAGARRPLTYVQNDHVHTIKGCRFGIGISNVKKAQYADLYKFTTHAVDISAPTMLYIYTDGYEDQFGGIENRKFYIKNLRKLFLNIHHLPIAAQREQLQTTLSNWRGNLPQTDDITIIGIRIEPNGY
ncbi:PP2C family protein-serine/threonine phosphatase [Rhodoflexus sp.]